MMPTSCRSMDSYPYQRNQMQFPPCYYPNIEANPPQMKMEPQKPPLPYEQPWHYASNYGHPMHFYCGHSNFHGCYGYRPSYHHHAPVPSPMYYSASSGGYPACGESFFVPYSPQPHYTMELPRYEYDKFMSRDYHCCGCPNHLCHQNDAKGAVKIEEEDPDAGKRMNDDDALAPVQMRNYPYPTVWIPPEYKSNKEVKNDAPIVDDRNDRKPWSPRNFRADAEEPGVRWNGWIPLDMNRVPNIVHEGDGRRRSSQNLQGENNTRESEDGRVNRKGRSDQKRSEFPFPIIWMPYYNKQEEESRRENNQNSNSSPKCIEEAPYTFKYVPVNPKVDEGVANGTGSNQVESTDRSGADFTKKITNEKIIPVKEVELHQGISESEESGGKRERTIPVYRIEENVTKKDSHTGREKLSTSPRKNGKLPPVCLRVDPLPRKKNGNGSSRSPSPPPSKEHSTIGEKSKAPSGGVDGKAHSNSDGKNDLNIGEKVKPKERTIAVSETKTNDKAPSGSMNDNAQPDSSPQNATNISVKVEPKDRAIPVAEIKTNENKEAKEEFSVVEKQEKKAEKGAKNTAEEGGKEIKVLSDVDAAVLIQAAYRGYQVRKWEPLKKLKQIDEVNKELTNVRGRVEALENSSDLQNDEKQRIAIGETIMRLLLKLDTIQGLHSSFREIRKSLARELTSLHERLDSITTTKPQQQTQEFADTKPVEEAPMNIQNEVHMQEQQEKKDAVPREDSVEGINHDTVEKCEEDQSQLLSDPTPNEIVDECNPASDVSESGKMVVEPEAKFEAENIPIEVDNSDSDAWRELHVGVIDEDVTDHSSKKDEQNDSAMRALDSASNGEYSDINPMWELPVGIIDEDTETSEFGKDDGSKVSEEEPRHEDAESLVELPVGVLDDDTVKPEFEKLDESETSKEVLTAEKAQCNTDEKTSFSIEDTAKETQLQQQLVEEQEEVQSTGESDGWVKVEFHKEDENKGDVSQDIEIENEEETKIKDESSILATQGNGEESMVEPAVTSSEEQEEKVSKEEPQVEDQDIVAEQENSYNNEDTETMNKKITEIPAVSPVSGVLDDVSEHDKGLNGDKNLLEENEKLREMMRKLLEAGNEQMNVITDLTGRVKDLEKRLARSKRVRTKRFKPATSKTGSNNNSS